ncbi:type II toxin-antitoxin system TacA family antitoxin [Cesiribacter andamanensis]|uniref:DUF1778 domain-containing protein n=1 Tax=Cesiribacter andamanensis AMV16 TaxID=1279009 RepID=M7MWX1_9BACT|nr:DUF1778 domain-containing protein [Cesiribacter andamanensis]EMR00918.1 hypothetical protein ADICEAN_03965 [Cesiribacter andamanensis AMV16]
MNSAITNAKARIETRVSQEQKELFEKAAALAGFNTLTDFILSTVKKKAEKIVKKHDNFLASERDREIFFEALLNPPKPNDRLRKAAERYKRIMEE